MQYVLKVYLFLGTSTFNCSMQLKIGVTKNDDFFSGYLLQFLVEVFSPSEVFYGYYFFENSSTGKYLLLTYFICSIKEGWLSIFSSLLQELSTNIYSFYNYLSNPILSISMILPQIGGCLKLGVKYVSKSQNSFKNLLICTMILNMLSYVG